MARRTLTKHRLALAVAFKKLKSTTLYLELALLGDSEQHKRRTRSEVRDASLLLQAALDDLVEDYDLEPLPVDKPKEQVS